MTPHDARASAVSLAVLLAGILAALGAAAQQQDLPLRRTFAVGDEWRYHVRLIVRSELEGPETLRIGGVTYVKTAQHAAEARVGWTATERVTRLAENRAANMHEEQEAFEALRLRLEPDADDAQAARLGESLRQMVSSWSKSRTLEFRVLANGGSAQLPPEAGPRLDEPPPPLLTLWLAHALRPAAALPERPVRVGEPWQEPRSVQVNGWTDVRAAETGEWLEAAAPRDYSAMCLHITQEISGRAGSPGTRSADAEGGAANGEANRPEGEKTGSFFAESLSTIGLADGRVLAASRSARKEIIQVLPPVGGMTEAPRFRATLSLQVEIEICVEGRCETNLHR